MEVDNGYTDTDFCKFVVWQGSEYISPLYDNYLKN